MTKKLTNEQELELKKKNLEMACMSCGHRREYGTWGLCPKCDGNAVEIVLKK